jgi:guanylate kinase
MNVILRRKAEFEKILQDYKPSTRAAQLLKSRPLVILLGVSGSGRNTIINHLVETGRYHFLVSDTTRPPKVRDGKMEQDGIQYFFRSEDDILNDLANGEFLEAEVIHNQQVSGISIRELERAYDTGKIPINEVDVTGTVNVLKAKPDTQMFFIVPPSYDEWMRRLHLRETMSTEELSNRTETAIKVLKTGLENEHFTFVINESSQESAQMIDKQVTTGVSDEDHHLKVREVAKGILAELEQHSA